MRRIVLFTVTTAAMVIAPVPARAATIQCPPYTTASRPCVGTDGPDTLYGTSVYDYIIGRAGNDTLWGYGGFDQLHAGDFSDTNRGGAHTDYLYGGKGIDGHKAGDGNDQIYDREGSDIWYPVEVDTACGWLGHDYIDVRDSDNWDYYSGGSGSNTIIKDGGDSAVSDSECDRMSG